MFKIKPEFKTFLVKIINNLIFFMLILALIFTRSFFGIKIIGFRLGELTVGFGLMLLIYFTVLEIIKKNIISQFQIRYLILVLISFLVSLFINSGALFDTYTFKSSSFIWMIGYLFFGIKYFQNLKFSKFHIYVLISTPYIIYIFNTGNYPNFIMGFFETYSDKFQFIKGSDVLMAIIFCLYLLRDNIIKFNFLIYFNISLGILLPLFLILSRASFFSAFILLLSLNISYRNQIKENFKKYLILITISFVFFLISSIRVAGLPEIDFSKNPEPVNLVQQSVSEIIVRKNTNKFFLGFYFCENRICSKDNTLDWRLDIWNDLVLDQINKNKMIFGFGFNEIFEIMKDPSAPGRLGRDGLNENVHNHLFTILGRLGIVGLFLYILFHIKILIPTKKETILYLIPLFLVSFFDTTMESVQFPLLYYLLISKSYTAN